MNRGSHLVFVMFCGLSQMAFGQVGITSSDTNSGCSAEDATFAVKLTQDRHNSPGNAEMSTVYFIERWSPPPNTLGHPTIKIAADGEWLGATKGNSSAVFEMLPGKHHLCVSWQTRVKRYQKYLTKYLSIDASSGGKYYILIQPDVTYDSVADQSPSLEFSSLDEDEAKHLLALVPSAQSSRKH